MSDFLWSRQALLAGASAIDTLVLVLAALALAAGSLAAWRAWTAPHLAIRWWSPIPERLERADGAYGAAALKEAYPDAFRKGVTSAGAVHIGLAILALTWMALAPKPETRPDIIIGPDIHFELPPRIVPQGDLGGGGRPALRLPDPRNVIPTPVDAHVLMPEIDDLAKNLLGTEDGTIFGDGPGGPDGIDGKPAGDATGPFGANALADPDPGDDVAVDQLPELVFMAEPKYPEMARLAGLEGVVGLRLLIDTDGRVRKSRVERSIAGLDEAALAAASTARFSPALWQGKPVKVWVALPIRFSLH